MILRKFWRSAHYNITHIGRPAYRERAVPGATTPQKITEMIARAATLALLLSAVGTAAHASPDKVAYELAKECGQSAEKFDREDSRRSTVDSLNHYNPTFNACYMLTE
jgi:hypothetical protein